MKDKHKQVAGDTELLRLIHKEVNEKLETGKRSFKSSIWLKFIFYFSTLSVFYIFLFQPLQPILFLSCFISYGIISLLFAFNFAHDFSHNTIFKNKKWNNLGFIIIYAINGAHAEAWKNRHIHSHHFAPNVEDYDTDLRISRLIRVIPGSKRLWYHRFQHLYAPLAYTTYSIFWIFIKDFVVLFGKSENVATNKLQYHISFWAQKLFYVTYILILPIIFSPQPFYLILLGFLFMHLIQSLFLLFTFFMTHHVESTHYPVTDKEGLINTSWLMNQVKSSNDMHPFSGFANFILGGFNNHIAHHLFPNVHHIYYPELNRILYTVLTRNNIIPNQTSYLGGIVSHLKLLKKMGKKEPCSL